MSLSGLSGPTFDQMGLQNVLSVVSLTAELTFEGSIQTYTLKIHSVIQGPPMQ